MQSRCSNLNRTKTAIPTPHSYRLRRLYAGCSSPPSAVQRALTRQSTPPPPTLHIISITLHKAVSAVPYPVVFFVLVFSLSRTVDLVRALFIALVPYPNAGYPCQHPDCGGFWLLLFENEAHDVMCAGASIPTAP